MRVAPPIRVDEPARRRLQAIAAGADARRALGARIVLLAAEGRRNIEIAEALAIGRMQVARWRERFLAEGEAALGRVAAGMEAAADMAIAHEETGRCFEPPRSARALMPREALQQRLLAARRQRCVLVQGQAGSGKTSTLLAWRKQLLALGFDVAWLSAGAEHGDVARFLGDVAAALGELAPGLAREGAVPDLREGEPGTLEAWAIALVQGIAAHPRPLALVLDDLHLLEDTRAFEALQWLLDYAPGQLHLALGSRTALPLSLERLRSQGELTEIDMRDLRFTPQESQRFLRAQLGDIGVREAAALHELADGWVAGLQLFALDLRGKGASARGLQQVRDARSFASYVEREVLVRLADEDAELLARAAACNRFTPSLAAAILQLLPAAAPRLAARLARFDRDGFFLTQAGSSGDEPFYRLQPLLRETLLARLASRPEEERRELHLTAWRWFEARGHVEEAFHHALQSGLVQQAVALVEANAHRLLASGELRVLAALLRQLPQEQVEGRFELHVAMAYLHLYSRHLQALDRCLQELATRWPALDARQRYELVLLRAALAAQRDEEVDDGTLGELRAIPADASELAWGARANVLSWQHLARGEAAQAGQVLQDAQLQSALPRSSLLGRCMASMGMALQGRVRQAEQAAREVLSAADARGPAFAGVSSMAAGLLAALLYELDEPEAARQLLEPRIDVLERVCLPEVVLRALAVLTKADWLAGRRPEAHAWLDRLQVHAHQGELPRLEAEALRLRQRLLLEEGEMRAAAEVRGRLAALAAAASGRRCGAAAAEAAVRAHAEACLAEGDAAQAAQRCAALLPDATLATPAQVALAMTRAAALHAQGDAQPALALAREAVAAGHRLGLLRTLVDAGTGTRAVLRALAAQEPLDPVLAFYVERLLRARAAAPQAGAGAAAAAPAAQPLTEREHEVLALLAQAMPNKRIALVLGVSPETVKYHLKNIYGKLGVLTRDQAVARLRERAAGLP